MSQKFFSKELLFALNLEEKILNDTELKKIILHLQEKAEYQCSAINGIKQLYPAYISSEKSTILKNLFKNSNVLQFVNFELFKNLMRMVFQTMYKFKLADDKDFPFLTLLFKDIYFLLTLETFSGSNQILLYSMICYIKKLTNLFSNILDQKESNDDLKNNAMNLILYATNVFFVALENLKFKNPITNKTLLLSDLLDNEKKIALSTKLIELIGQVKGVNKKVTDSFENYYLHDQVSLGKKIEHINTKFLVGIEEIIKKPQEDIKDLNFFNSSDFKKNTQNDNQRFYFFLSLFSLKFNDVKKKEFLNTNEESQETFEFFMQSIKFNHLFLELNNFKSIFKEIFSYKKGKKNGIKIDEITKYELSNLVLSTIKKILTLLVGFKKSAEIIESTEVDFKILDEHFKEIGKIKEILKKLKNINKSTKEEVEINQFKKDFEANLSILEKQVLKHESLKKKIKSYLENIEIEDGKIALISLKDDLKPKLIELINEENNSEIINQLTNLINYFNKTGETNIREISKNIDKILSEPFICNLEEVKKDKKLKNLFDNFKKFFKKFVDNGYADDINKNIDIEFDLPSNPNWYFSLMGYMTFDNSAKKVQNLNKKIKSDDIKNYLSRLIASKNRNYNDSHLSENYIDYLINFLKTEKCEKEIKNKKPMKNALPDAYLSSLNSNKKEVQKLVKSGEINFQNEINLGDLNDSDWIQTEGEINNLEEKFKQQLEKVIIITPMIKTDIFEKIGLMISRFKENAAKRNFLAVGNNEMSVEDIWLQKLDNYLNNPSANENEFEQLKKTFPPAFHDFRPLSKKQTMEEKDKYVPAMNIGSESQEVFISIKNHESWFEFIYDCKIILSSENDKKIKRQRNLEEIKNFIKKQLEYKNSDIDKITLSDLDIFINSGVSAEFENQKEDYLKNLLDIKEFTKERSKKDEKKLTLEDAKIEILKDLATDDLQNKLKKSLERIRSQFIESQYTKEDMASLNIYNEIDKVIFFPFSKLIIKKIDDLGLEVDFKHVEDMANKLKIETWKAKIFLSSYLILKEDLFSQFNIYDNCINEDFKSNLRNWLKEWDDANNDEISSFSPSGDAINGTIELLHRFLNFTEERNAIQQSVNSLFDNLKRFKYIKTYFKKYFEKEVFKSLSVQLQISSGIAQYLILSYIELRKKYFQSNNDKINQDQIIEELYNYPVISETMKEISVEKLKAWFSNNGYFDDKFNNAIKKIKEATTNIVFLKNEYINFISKKLMRDFNIDTLNSTVIFNEENIYSVEFDEIGRNEIDPSLIFILCEKQFENSKKIQQPKTAPNDYNIHDKMEKIEKIIKKNKSAFIKRENSFFLFKPKLDRKEKKLIYNESHEEVNTLFNTTSLQKKDNKRHSKTLSTENVKEEKMNPLQTPSILQQ